MKHNLKTLTINFTQTELNRVKKELQQKLKEHEECDRKYGKTIWSRSYARLLKGILGK